LITSYYARDMSKSVRNKFGKNIRELRKQKGWSQELLAEKVDLHRSYISVVERGEKNLSLDNIAKIAKTLGVTIETLFKGL
jgi:transcriptional regulator with XRE-family HTH domain